MVGGGERDGGDFYESKQLSGFVAVTPNSIALLPILQVSHRTKRHLEFLKKNCNIFFYVLIYNSVAKKKKKKNIYVLIYNCTLKYRSNILDLFFLFYCTKI